MPKSRAVVLVDKSEAALMSAIEIYNKPDYKYRDETFSILALNAWELLFKAKLLDENDNNSRCLRVYEKKRKANGEMSTKLYVKRNRAGNPLTIGLHKAMADLENNHAVAISPSLKSNIDALTEIRDNAVHFVNVGLDLYKQVLEIGTATVRNYVTLIKLWFERDLSKYNFFLMPLGFVRDSGDATALTLSPNEKKVVNYLADLTAASQDAADTDFHASLSVKLSFQRSRADTASAVIVTNDPNATPVRLTEENIQERYPWDYGELTRRLSARYIDFTANQHYHDLRKPLMTDPRFVNRRYLNPTTKTGLKKDYYSPNILQEFDKHYTRK